LAESALERKRRKDRERWHGRAGVERNAARRERYANDPEYRAREQDRSITRRSTPEQLAARRERERARPRPYKRRSRPYVPDPAKERERRRAYRNSRAGLAREALRKSIPTPRSGLPWTEEEDAVVCRDDISHMEMACLTGRSPSACSGRRAIVRLGHTKELKGPFSQFRQCARCDASFTAHSPSGRYCSAECRRRGNYEYRRAWSKKGPNKITCPNCGKRATVDPRARYCSKRCRQAFGYRNEKARKSA
jgi:hypothetical protein